MLKTLTFDRILSQTDKLFPSKVVTHGLSEDLQPEYVLAWLAHAWDNRKALHTPHILVYRRLQKGDKLPNKCYQADPLSYLPNAFLVALGLAEPEIIDVEPEAVDEPEYPYVECITETIETIDAEIVSAWDAVMKKLRAEIRKAQYETWVQGADTYSYSDGLLSIAVRNTYAADWLTKKVQSSAQRILREQLGFDVRVAFVVETDVE